MATPVRIDMTTANPSTGRERWIRVSGSNGRKFAAIFGTKGTTYHARNAPAIPAKTLTSKLSNTNSRTTLPRDAPIAMRNAISRRLPLNLTSSRFATLLHAINKTNATAASSVAKAGRKFPVTSSGKVLSVMTDELSILSGYRAR
jgi:hypothetical protein